MSQRLAELQRQRALLQEHLDWLEREIAAEQLRSTEPTSAPVSSPGVEPTAPAEPSPTPSAMPAAPAAGTATTVATAADTTIATTINVVAPAPLTAPSRPIAGSLHGPDEILDQYRIAPDTLRNDIRKGCFLYFALAFVLLAIGVGALWVLFRV